jgi:predicted permease
MPFLGSAWRRFLFLLRRRQMHRDLAEEMREHAALKMQKNVDAGMTAQEARAAALRQFGNMTRLAEDSRQSWGFPWLENLLQDVRYGLRGLLHARGFTVVGTLTLALGIGTCTAIFSIVHTVMLRPLPYKDSARMIQIWTTTPMFPDFRIGQSWPNSKDIQELSRSLEAGTFYTSGTKNLTGAGEPEQISTAAIRSDFFSFFGISPIQGRRFVAGDERMQDGKVALMSYRLWQSHFGGDPGIVGRRITLGQEPFTVVGVMPPKFSFPQEADLWEPLVVDAEQQANRQEWRYLMIAKLKPGVSLKNAQLEMNEIAAVVAQRHPQEASGVIFPVDSLQQTVIGNQKGELLALVGAVGFLLLIACANVGNLVLSRGLKRQREIAMRAALGASRARIFRQLLVESSLLALAGGLAGGILAICGISFFRALAPAHFPRLAEVRLEPATAFIAFAVTASAGILCGFAPALSASRSNLIFALKEKAATLAPRHLRLRRILVVGEIALAVMLLTGSALMVQSMIRLLHVDTGLNIENVVSANLTLPKARYGSDDAFREFARRLLEALQAQREFSKVALSNSTVMKGGLSLSTLDRQELAAYGIHEDHLTLESRSVSPGFFETLAIPLVRGRFFDDHDIKGATSVIIINDSMARRFFPGQDPIGKALQLGDKADERYQVVGQVRDTLDVSLQGKRQLQIYLPMLQHGNNGSNFLSIIVHTSGAPSSAAAALRSAVASVDKDQPLTHIQSIHQAIAESVAQPRFHAWLISLFAVSGLGLTLIGIYGVISYSVGQRTQEMAIRMALGAQHWSVLRLILREGAVLAAIGSACGVIGSLLVMWLLASQLYGVRPRDPATIIGTTLAMLLVALWASYIPARRATKVDPMAVLRTE